MPDAVRILIATATDVHFTTLRTCVVEACHEIGLQEQEDFVIRNCATGDTLSKQILEASSDEHELLIIAEPALTDNENIVHIFVPLVQQKPQCLFIVNLIRAGLRGLAIPPDRIIRDMDADALTRLSDWVAHSIRTAVQRGLEDYNRFAIAISEYRGRYLSPLFSGMDAVQSNRSEDGQAAPVPNTAREAIEATTTEEAEAHWERLASEIQQQADQSREKAIQAKGTGATTDERLLALAHALLHLWVEARLYAVRARTNFRVYHNARQALISKRPTARLERIPPGFGLAHEERRQVRAEVGQIVADYQRALREFDTKLHDRHVKEWRRFTRWFGDAQQFRVWSETFGITGVMAEREPGWEFVAATVGNELYYTYRNMLRHEHFLVRSQWSSAFVLWVYQVVAGYGFRPGRAARVALSTFALFSVLHAMDDYTTPGCGMALTVERIQYYVAVSVSSFTNLGSVAVPCGRFHVLLLSAESLVGYFLLAVLTTLFIQSLLDR